jgi:hypothetical protein
MTEPRTDARRQSDEERKRASEEMFNELVGGRQYGTVGAHPARLSLIEGAVYRMNDREYRAVYVDGVWQLRSVDKGKLMYRIYWDGRSASIKAGSSSTRFTINDLEFVRETA